MAAQTTEPQTLYFRRESVWGQMVTLIPAAGFLRLRPIETACAVSLSLVYSNPARIKRGTYAKDVIATVP